MKGGYRPGAGRPPKSDESINKAAVAAKVSPLEYMLNVMNDGGADASRRDRMAIAAAPFVHGKVADDGKKETRKKAAEEAGKGKFNPGKAPKLVVSNK